jgi:hypothetical protein
MYLVVVVWTADTAGERCSVPDSTRAAPIADDPNGKAKGGGLSSARPSATLHWPRREDLREISRAIESHRSLRVCSSRSHRGGRRPQTGPDWQMGVREWPGRVDAILAAIHGPITRRGGQNPQRPRAPIGGLHVLAISLHPAQPEWPAGLQKAGSRCTRQPNYRHSTPSSAIHRHSSQLRKKPLATCCHWARIVTHAEH